MEYQHRSFLFEDNNLDEGLYPFELFDHQFEDNLKQNYNNFFPCCNTLINKPFNILHNVIRTPKERDAVQPLSAKSKLIQKREKAKQRQFLKTLNSKQEQFVIACNDQEIKSQISTTENSSEKVEKIAGCTKLSEYQLKLYKKQIRNRISAQKSREKQKLEFQKLMRQNKVLQCKERNKLLEEENEKLKDLVLQYEEKLTIVSSQQLCQESNFEINCNYSQNLRFPRANHLGQVSPKKNFFMTSLVLITILSCCTIFQLDQNGQTKNKFYNALMQTKQYFTENNCAQEISKNQNNNISNFDYKSIDFQTILSEDSIFQTIPNEYSQITNFCFGKNFQFQNMNNNKLNETNIQNSGYNCSFIL